MTSCVKYSDQNKKDTQMERRKLVKECQIIPSMELKLVKSIIRNEVEDKDNGCTQIKTIRFGQQGVTTAGKPKAGESARQKARRKSFKARHAKNIAKGKMSAAYWANKVKW